MKPINNNMYAIKPNINFKNLLFSLFFTKNINAIAKNIQPIDPNDIHILSIEDTNNTTTTSTPFSNKKVYHRTKSSWQTIKRSFLLKIVFQINSQKELFFSTTLSICDKFRTFYNLLIRVF